MIRSKLPSLSLSPKSQPAWLPQVADHLVPNQVGADSEELKMRRLPSTTNSLFSNYSKKSCLQ